MPANNERRGRQRSDGRRADQQRNNSNAGLSSSSGRATTSSSTSFRSKQFVLPEDYSYNPSNNGSPGAADQKSNSARTRGNPVGNGSPRSPGARLPPPPPRPSHLRGRNNNNSSFNSMTSGGNDHPRARSLSTTARVAPSSSRLRKSGQELKDDEAKDNLSNRRGRSLSAARYSQPAVASSNTQLPLPLIDIDGKQRTRSPSASKSRRRKQKVQQQQQQKQQPRRSSKKDSPSNTQKNAPYAATRQDSNSPDHRRSSDTNEDASQSFKQVMAKNSASSHRSRSRSRSRSRGNKDHERSTSCSKSRSRSKARTNADDAKSKDPSVPTRKFVLEIGNNGGIIQVFEFSNDGTLDASNVESWSQYPAFIQNILRKYSTDSNDSFSTHSSGRKIMVESDDQDNIIQVFEFSDNGALPVATESKRRAESPFSKRVADYEKDTAETTWEARPTSASGEVEGTQPYASSPGDTAPGQKKSSQLRSRSVSMPRRSRTSDAPSRSSLRSSFKTVSFALDNEGDASLKPAAFNTSDKSFESTESSRRATARSVAFAMDNQEVHQSTDASGLNSSISSNHNVSSYPQPPVYGSLSDQNEKNNEASDRLGSGSFVSEQDNSETPSSLTVDSMASSQSHAPAYAPLDMLADQDNKLSAGSMSGQVQNMPEYLQQTLANESTTDASERSNDSSVRRSMSSIMEQEEVHTAASSTTTSAVAGNQVYGQVYRPQLPPPPPPRGRAGEYLKGFRRARSLSRNHSSTDQPSITINDTSSLTATSISTPPRGRRSEMKSPIARGREVHPPPPRQARSLSRSPRMVSPSLITDDTSSLTGNSIGRGRPNTALARGHQPTKTIPAVGSQESSEAPRTGRSLSRTRIPLFRDVDFDPTANARRSPKSNKKNKKKAVSQRDARPLDHVPDQKSKTNDNGSSHPNHATDAVGMDHPLMNSNITIFESDCDDEDQSLLSNPSDPSLPPTMRMQERPATPINEVNAREQNLNCKKEVTKEERRSRIRKILSRKALSKRRPATLANSKGSLDKSEDTRETTGTDGSWPSSMMESAESSLLRQQHQQEHAQGQELEGRQRSRRPKSRLSRLLNR